jgi:hypothetical protein
LLLQHSNSQQGTGCPATGACAATAADTAAATLAKQQAQLAALEQKVGSAQLEAASLSQQLQWSKCEAEHLQHLLQQQQEISMQLRAEVGRLQQHHQQQQQAQLDTPAPAKCPSAWKALTIDVGCQTEQLAEVLQLQHLQADQRAMVQQLTDADSRERAARSELAQLHQQLQLKEADYTAARQELKILQLQMDNLQHSQQHLTTQLSNKEQQLEQQAHEMATQEQQVKALKDDLQQQQQQLLQQERQALQQQQQVQQSLDATSQSLDRCKADLAQSCAAVAALQQAGHALKQQLQADLAALSAPGQTLVAAFQIEVPREPAAAASDAGFDLDVLQHCLLLAARLGAAAAAALQAQHELKLDNAAMSQQLNQQMIAAATAEIAQHELQLTQLQLQQQSQLNELRLQQQQQQQQQLGPTSGSHAVSSVLAMMEQLHLAVCQSSQEALSMARASASTMAAGAASIGAGPSPSSCSMLITPRQSLHIQQGAGVPKTDVPMASARAVRALYTPQTSLDAPCLAPPTVSLSPQCMAVTGAAKVCAAAAGGGSGSILRRQQLSNGPQSTISSEPTNGGGGGAAAAGGGGGGAAAAADVMISAAGDGVSELGQLRRRLTRLSQDMMQRMQPSLQQQQLTHQLAAVTCDAVHAADASGGNEGNDEPCNIEEAVAGVPKAAHVLHSMQDQFAGHDRLLQQLRLMWQQVGLEQQAGCDQCCDEVACSPPASAVAQSYHSHMLVDFCELLHFCGLLLVLVLLQLLLRVLHVMGKVRTRPRQSMAPKV